MTGFRRDIPEVMAALDVLVLPSVRSEAFPQVIPQALAVGTPVIGTTVGGIPEIVRDGDTGRLVPPGGRAGACRRHPRGRCATRRPHVPWRDAVRRSSRSASPSRPP